MSIYLESGKIKEAKNFSSKIPLTIDENSKTGVISKKTASRKISRVTKKINNSKKNKTFCK